MKNKILLPVIRKVLPNTIAESIVGVQPMTGPVGSIFKMKSSYSDRVDRRKFYRIDQSKDGLPNPPVGYVIIDVDDEISVWIETNKIDLWKPGEVPAYSADRNRYIIHEELYTYILMKWS